MLRWWFRTFDASGEEIQTMNGIYNLHNVLAFTGTSEH